MLEFIDPYRSPRDGRHLTPSRGLPIFSFHALTDRSGMSRIWIDAGLDQGRNRLPFSAPSSVFRVAWAWLGKSRIGVRPLFADALLKGVNLPSNHVSDSAITLLFDAMTSVTQKCPMKLRALCGFPFVDVHRDT